MTKKHYEMIAQTIRNQYAVETGDTKQGIYNIAMLLAHTFEQDNPKFNRIKFLEACGMGVE